jgi:tRNA A37 methylthiotransferase MiaB
MWPLPIHISDDMLKLMKRTTTAKDIKGTIATLRRRLPGIIIRTSLMVVGFRGETEEHFKNDGLDCFEGSSVHFLMQVHVQIKHCSFSDLGN